MSKSVHERTTPEQRTRVDYGLDAPGVVRALAGAGAVLMVAGVFSYTVLRTSQPDLAITLVSTCAWPGLAWLFSAGWMVWGSRIGKVRLRDRLLASVPWRGDEQVLDVGCGHGLLLIGAAKHLTTGRAIGIDLWSAKDQAGNRPEATARNVALEDVAARVELATGDMRSLPFANASFDVVLSSWALHNIPTPEGRKRAVHEIARVLKPGGRVLILDIWYTRTYAQVFAEVGLRDVRRRLASLGFVLPTFLVEGQKAVQ